MPEQPLVRLVRLTLRPDAIEEFLDIFAEAAPRIRATPGCLSLELWQDTRYPNILSTHSRWQTAAALEAYRSSAYFEATWKRTRALFAAPPFAASHNLVTDDRF
ncbi:MAG: antibiotic biosynthesis monooxygenase [Rhodothermales bacterium]|nr:antibiotic biosynthesis monooxygenase [Rhodothermales bacterium]MBO6779822.1 antibiotic biosynthesis monooxygenase [Rhodothermales bacterium]